MTKAKISIVIMLLIVLAIGGALFYQTPNFSTSQDFQVKNMEFSSKIVDYNTLDQVIEYADRIVVGTVIMENTFSDTVSKYTLAIKTDLKGSIDTQNIDVYESIGKLSIGKNYLLFLEELNHPLYSEYSYTDFEKSMILEFNQDKLVNDNKFFSKETDLERISKLINKSEAKLKIKNKDYIVLNQLETINDLIEKSDYILRIIPSELIKRNANTTEVIAKVIQQYKGSHFDENIPIFLSGKVQKDKEYLIFLNNYNGAILPTTRKGSLIESGTTEFVKIIDFLSN